MITIAAKIIRRNSVIVIAITVILLGGLARSWSRDTLLLTVGSENFDWLRNACNKLLIQI